MRRLVVELPKDEFIKTEGGSELLQNVKTLQVLTLISHSDEEITMICRVELETDVGNIEDTLDSSATTPIMCNFLSGKKAAPT